MKFFRSIGLMACAVLLFSACAGNAFAATKKHTSKSKTTVSKKSSGKKSTSKKAKSKKGAWKKRGQQSIAADRTVQIQEALIREGYLKSEATGAMDNNTKEALVRLQKENGWQTKVVPDSRALIRLGLGPDHSNLLNPQTAVLPGAGTNSAAVRITNR